MLNFPLLVFLAFFVCKHWEITSQELHNLQEAFWWKQRNKEFKKFHPLFLIIDSIASSNSSLSCTQSANIWVDFLQMIEFGFCCRGRYNVVQSLLPHLQLRKSFPRILKELPQNLFAFYGAKHSSQKGKNFFFVLYFQSSSFSIAGKMVFANKSLVTVDTLFPIPQDSLNLGWILFFSISKRTVKISKIIGSIFRR